MTKAKSDNTGSKSSAKKRSKTIYTIGHGTRSFAELLAILEQARITKVIDVRRFPNSRTNPQFNESDFSRALEKAGIAYRWMGDVLGGRKGKHDLSSLHSALRVTAFKNYAASMATEEWQRGIHELCEESGTKVYLCSETLWWRCHRRMISDYLVLHGWTVLHLGIKKDEAVEHIVWDVVRVTPDGMLIYDQGA